MKALELINLLNRINPDSEVLFTMISGCCGDFVEMEVSDYEVKSYNDKNTTNSFVNIEFLPLPGYKSCRQSAGTVNSDNEYWKDKK